VDAFHYICSGKSTTNVVAGEKICGLRLAVANVHHKICIERVLDYRWKTAKSSFLTGQIRVSAERFID